MKVQANLTAAVLATGVILGSTAAHAACAALNNTWTLSAQASNGTSIACVLELTNGTIVGGGQSFCGVFAKGKPPSNKPISGKINSNSCILTGNFTVQGQPKVSVKQGILVDAGTDVTIGGGIGTIGPANAPTEIVNLQLIRGAI